MWKPYLKVIAKKAPQALNILDRFHIVSHLTKAVNQVRVDEVRRLKEDGYDEAVLRHTKYCFLKNPKNLTPKQEETRRCSRLRSKKCPSLLAERKLSAVLGLRQPVLG